MKKPIRLCLEPAGPVSRFGTHGPWALSTAFWAFGKVALKQIGLDDPLLFGVVLRGLAAAEVQTAFSEGRLGLGLPGNLIMKESFCFNITQFKEAQAIRKH